MLVANSESCEPSSQNSNATTPNLLSNDDRKKRRSATERRASHRRRSSQAIAESGQLSQLLNGLQHQQRRGSNGSQHSVDMEGERSNNTISPIPDHHSDDPPEPTIPAPGGEEEDFDLEINSDPLDSLDHQTQDSGTDGQQSTPVIPSNSNNSLSAGFTPMHQRSVSDHLLHSVESARRRQQEISTTPGKEIHQEDATNNNKNSNAQHKNGSKLANQQHIFQSNSASKKQRAIVSTKAPPPLSQIRKLQQDDVENIANRQVDEPSSPKMRDNSDWHSPERGGAQDSSVSGSSTFGGQPTNKGPDRPPIAHHNFASNSFSSSSASSSGFAQLVGRFSAHRQHSDSNLLRRTSPSIEEPARRSFKWKILWGRKSRVLEDITGKMDSHGMMKTAAHHQLGPLPEDSESELLGQKKRHSAIIEDAKQTPTPGGGTFVRMRASSSTEAIAGRDRPFSLMGTGGEELARYRVCEDEWQRLQLFLREQRAKEEPPPSTTAGGGGVAEWDDSLEEEAITGIGHHPPPRRCPPPRMTRPAMGAAAASSPISSSQTLGRPTKQKIQRAISTRAGASNAANVCSTLTLPRKKLPPKVAAQQQRRRNGAFVQQANRRRSIVHIGAEERQAIVAFVAEQQASTAAAAAKQEQKRTTGIGGGGTSSLKQLLNAGDRSRAKVAPKTKSGSSIAEQEQLATSINCRVDKDRKREAKANSVILNHIWSIRPRRKKEPNNSQRSLANLWTCQLDQRKANGGAAAAGDAPLSSSGFDSPLPPPHHPSSAQSPLSPPVDGSPFGLLDDVDSTTTTTTAPLFQRPQLTQPRWEDLDLWAEQAPNWASKFADDRNFPGMAAAERKRQNVIYELVLTERNHCQVLVLLQQLYREGLLNNQIVSEEQLNTLIPDVLDALLDFHLTLLRRLKARCSEASVVEGVVDILIEHFQAGDHHRTAAIHAYTHFCLGREESDQQFASLMAQSQQFRKFMQFHGSEHKERTLKDCMLLVAQRLTKYPVLVEQMVKLESQAQRRELGQRACAAVRACCNEVDQRLQRHELDRQWSRLKKALDKAGTAKMIDPKGGQEFAANDLIWPVETEAGRGLRRVLLITRAFWRETMNGPDVELRLLLCDDLIVLLRPKSANSSSSNGGSSGKMPPLNFFRHNEHAGVLPLHSTLVRGENLRRKSLLLIVTAKERPDLFELAFPTCSELNNCVQAIKRAKAEAPTFVRMASGKFFELAERTIEEWDGRREELEFQGRVDQWRKELDKMFEEQTKAEEQLAQYFETRMAFMEKVRAQLEAIPRRRGLPSTGGGGGMDEDSKQLREHMRVRFGELKRFKAGSLVKLTERAQRLRDGDLLSWIDDLHDLGQGQLPAAAESSSDESPARSDSSEERRKPRRVCTYHGAADHQRQRNSGGSSGSAGGGIRRHTTVPGSRGPPITSSEEEERDEKSRLPLRVGPSQRRAAAELIRENIRLRSGLNKLKAKSALQELHLAALRSRCAREKAEEQIQPRQALEQMALELANREAELKRREAELTERETAIQPQASQEPGTQTTVVKLKLDVKQQQQRENQKEAVQPQPTSSSSPPANGASTAGVRISQTYCGAGPVPSRAANAVDSPQLNADRRAISQTELPRHLAVKTETKQRRK